MPNTHETLTSLFSDIATSIRGKTGKSAAIIADNFPDEIDSIVLGSGNAVPADVLSGKTFSNDSGAQTGTMPNNGAVSQTINTQGGQYTIPAGYHNGSGKVTASLGNATITSGAGSATISDPSYNSTNDNYDLTASGTVGAPTVGTAGYISSTAGTKNTNTVSGSKTLAKVGTGADITGVTTKAPTLARTAKPSGDTWTDAASGAATATKPTSGPYVQIDAAANTGTLTATPKVTSAGYGTTTSGQYTATPATATVGAAKATTRYVPITTTSASVSGKTVSYGTGWITGGSKSVADGAYSASASAALTTTPVVTPSVSGTSTNITTTTKPSGTDGTDYWTLDPVGTVTTVGSATATGTATIGTAGYIAAGSKSGTGTVSITPTVDGGTNRYLVKGTASTPATTKAQSTPSISINSSGLITASVAATSVSVTPTVTAGYIASGNAGTITMSASSNTKQMTTKAATTYTPGTSNQTIAASTYLLGTQTILGDADLVAGNIKVGTDIFGVTGTFTNDANATASDIASGKTAYVNGSKITGTGAMASGDVTSFEYSSGKVAICYLSGKGSVAESTDVTLTSSGSVTTSGSDIILNLADAC